MPNRPGKRCILHTQRTDLPHRAGRNRAMSAPCARNDNNFCRLQHPPTGRYAGLGELPRCLICRPRVHSVLPADLYYVPAALCGELEYPDDVHPDAWQSCLGE